MHELDLENMKAELVQGALLMIRPQRIRCALLPLV
jgi:hypothetical protein